MLIVFFFLYIRSGIINRYIFDYSTKNGLGKPSLSIYFKGCDKPTKCTGCHNPELQEEAKNRVDFLELKDKLINKVNSFLDFHDDLIVCYVGGEPLTKYNKSLTYSISRFIKEQYNGTNIIYSWKTNKIIKMEGLKKYLKYIDYGVLGSFKLDKKVENKIPSSSNQYIYDFNKNKEIEPIQLKEC